MDIKTIISFAVLTTCVLASDSFIQSIHHQRAYMDHRVTLPCVFHGQDWIMMRWLKVVDSESTVLLATNLPSFDKPKWASTAPEEFKDHVELHKENGDKTATFNLIIDGFMCPDAGTYLCEVMSLTAIQPFRANATVEIQVHPEQPKINPDIMEAKENSTFNIECYGNVGKPAAELRWSYKLANSDVYQMILENVVQNNTPARDCMYKGESRITVEMTPELDGARFMCYTSHNSEETASVPGNHDIVILELTGKTTTTPVPPSTTPFYKQSYTADDTGSASSHMLSSLVVFACLAVSLLSRTLFYRS